MDFSVPLASLNRRILSSCLLFSLVWLFVPDLGFPASQNPSTSAQIQSLYKAGMNLVQEKRFDQAIESFERGLRLEPTSLLLLNALGATYSLKGNKENAQQYFLKALDLSPEFEPARKNLAIGYFESGKYDLAAQEFERLLHSSGSQAVAHLFLGMIGEKQRHYKQAIEFLEKAEDLVFRYPRAVLSLAQSLCESDQLEKSSQVLDRLGEASGLSAGDWFQAGILDSRLGQYHQALKNFERAKQTDPDLKGVDYQRALVLDKMGRSKESLRLLQELTSKEQEARSFNLLGHVAENAREIDLAIQAYRKAAKLRPDDEDNYLDYSTLCMNYKNFSLALEIVDAGLAIIPHSYRLRVQKGAVLTELGRVEESKESFRFAMNLQ